MYKKQNVTRKQRDAIHRVLDEVISGSMVKDAAQLKANRKYIIHDIIETYCTWNEYFDCLPEIMQIGAYNPKYLRFIECNEKGELSSR